MSRPKLLDLYCCEGGASRGYEQAGFDVYGVDLFRYQDGVDKHGRPIVKGYQQSRYPYPSHQGDVITVLTLLIAGAVLPFTSRDGTVEWLGLADFHAIAASPPCQAYSITKHSHDVKHADLVGPTRNLLQQTGLPYVIENVVGAPLLDPLLLCGSMFDLATVDDDGTPLRMERHRLFESNVLLMSPGACSHDKRIRVAGAYGGGSADRHHAQFVRRGGYTPAKHVRAALLGLNAEEHTLAGLSQSIPPAYTRWIGEQVIATLPAQIGAAA